MKILSRGWEDPLEKGIATHPSILAWRIPWTEEPGGLQAMGPQGGGMTEQLTLSLSYTGMELLGHQFSSVQPLSRVRLCDPMNRSTPGLPVHRQLPEFTQTHVHRVGDAIQPSHPLSSPSPPAPTPSHHQSLFQ